MNINQAVINQFCEAEQLSNISAVLAKRLEGYKKYKSHDSYKSNTVAKPSTPTSTPDSTSAGNIDAADLAVGLPHRFVKTQKDLKLTQMRNYQKPTIDEPVAKPEPVNKFNKLDNAKSTLNSSLDKSSDDKPIKFTPNFTNRNDPNSSTISTQFDRSNILSQPKPTIVNPTTPKPRFFTDRNNPISSAVKLEPPKPYTPIKTGGADSTPIPKYTPIKTGGVDSTPIPKPSVSQVATPNPMVNTPSGTVTDSVKGIVGNLGNIASKAHEAVKTVVPGATPMQTAIGALGAGLVAKKFLSRRR